MTEIPAFERRRYLGTGAAIHERVRGGDGIAVLPRYLVEPDVQSGRLEIVLPSIRPTSDWFRLLFRSASPRVALMQRIADVLQALELR